jgi:hypothetical protein
MRIPVGPPRQQSECHHEDGASLLSV